MGDWGFDEYLIAVLAVVTAACTINEVMFVRSWSKQLCEHCGRPFGWKAVVCRRSPQQGFGAQLVYIRCRSCRCETVFLLPGR